jgi:hypothetical protein
MTPEDKEKLTFALKRWLDIDISTAENNTK